MKTDLNNMAWISNQPYNELPKLPPHADLENKKVLKACISPRASLEGFI
jgi:hypothetical protein